MFFKKTDTSLSPVEMLIVETNSYWQEKQAALSCYQSQDELGRIRLNDINTHEQHYSRVLGTGRVEAFETLYQDRDDAMRLLARFGFTNEIGSTPSETIAKKTN